MCGIAGLVAPPGRTASAETLAAMVARLAHRGPDDVGFGGWDGTAFRAGKEPDAAAHAQVALGHRRLSILDLSAGGWQPMSSPDGARHVVYNGEIYNFRELRTELEAAGRTFRSTSDTEVLLAAWDQWGRAALPRFTGMFAFALLDTRARTLTLARDPFGIKPLVLARGAHGLAFASEIKALLEVPGLPRTVDPRRLYRYIRYGLTDDGDGTLFAAVRQLPAGHVLEVPLDDPGAGTPERWFALDVARAQDIAFDEAVTRVRELFLRSVSLHLRSDVPLGAALSGGVDSSAIVAAMRAVEPALEIHAISYFAGDPALDEERWATLAAEAAGATIHAARPEPHELVRDLEALVASQDEPFGSTSIYAQRRVFEAARAAGITVMLDGQGADETFAGYRPYVAARLLSQLRAGDAFGALRLLASAVRQPGAGFGPLASWMGAQLLPAGLDPWARALTGRPRYPAWLDGTWFDAREAATPFPRPPVAGRALAELLAFTIAESSLPMLLRYEDRNSMASSIESRVPFLEPDLVRFALSLPEEYLLGQDATTKNVFRAAMRGLVPERILDRRDKIGFATPELDWLTRVGPWVEDVLTSEAARAIPALHARAMLAEWHAVRDLQRPFDWRVWRFINLVRWSELTGAVYAG